MHVLIGPILCTKGVANVRRDHDGVGAAGRAAGRVAGVGAAQALAARAPHHLRPGPAHLRARHDLSRSTHRRLLHSAVRPYVFRRNRFESQLGNNSRYVAGKRLQPQGRLWTAIGFGYYTNFYTKPIAFRGSLLRVAFLFYLCFAW